MGTSVYLVDYCRLLDEYDVLIDRPDWYTLRHDLVSKMDSLWNRLSAPEREAAYIHQVKAYERRLQRNHVKHASTGT